MANELRQNSKWDEARHHGIQASPPFFWRLNTRHQVTDTSDELTFAFPGRGCLRHNRQRRRRRRSEGAAHPTLSTYTHRILRDASRVFVIEMHLRHTLPASSPSSPSSSFSVQLLLCHRLACRFLGVSHIIRLRSIDSGAQASNLRSPEPAEYYAPLAMRSKAVALAMALNQILNAIPSTRPTGVFP